MTITKCDRCGKEIPDMNGVYIVEGGAWNRPTKRKRIELCEWCFMCWLDWPNDETQGTTLAQRKGATT